MSVLVFDSGVGGLSILRELRLQLPGERFIYVGDDAGFPYGDWDDSALTDRIVGIFTELLKHFQPDIAIVACNTASTLIMPALRNRFDIPFVGTVPPIKPAAHRTASGLVTLLGTPGTIKREYTHQLIREYASKIEVNLVGAQGLARLAEDYLLRRQCNDEALLREMTPCFISRDGRQTDIVILGCTHYPFLVDQMRRLAPWPVDWIDPSEAIASRASDVLIQSRAQQTAMENTQVENDIAIVTSASADAATESLMASFSLTIEAMPELLRNQS